MITQRTVFVLGAGASYAYGFPTGLGLVNQVIGLASEERLHDAFLHNACIPKEVKQFARDLEHSQLQSVDAFLENRPDFLTIGKIAMCLALIPAERDEFLTRWHQQSREGRGAMTWYHYLWNQMACPRSRFGDNRVAFITLNYDRSLERYLFLSLRAQHGYDDTATLTELYQLRFIHLYGRLGDAEFRLRTYGRPSPDAVDVGRAAEELRIIHEEITETEHLSEAVRLLRQAEVVCFLGYGFHEINNTRLTLKQLAADDSLKDQRWFASRYGMTEVEFRRGTHDFLNRFMHSGYIKGRVGEQNDGALEVLRKLPVM